MIETYGNALLDNGSEVTLCHERLVKEPVLDGEVFEFNLTRMTGSEKWIVNWWILWFNRLMILQKSQRERTLFAGLIYAAL